MPLMLLLKLKSWGKYIGLAALALIPIIGYMFGRKDGVHSERQKGFELEIKRRDRQMDFFKGVTNEERKADANKPRTRRELTDRLRGKGL